MRSSSLGVLLLLALPVLTSCCPFISWNRDPPSDLTENRELGPRPLYNPPDYNDVKKDIVGLVLYNDQVEQTRPLNLLAEFGCSVGVLAVRLWELRAVAYPARLALCWELP